MTLAKKIQELAIKYHELAIEWLMEAVRLPMDSIAQQPSGQWTFDITGGRLEQDCILPSLRNVTSLQVQNGTEFSFRGGRNGRSTASTKAQHPATVAD